MQDNRLTVDVWSSLVGYLLLVDTMQAVHRRRTPNFSTSELFIKMPSSNHHFRTVHNSMSHGRSLPADVQSPEDALLLVTAMLSDIIYMQHCHHSGSFHPDPRDDGSHDPLYNQDRPLRNPFVPLSVRSESCRLSAEMLAALSRWEHHFKHQVGPEILGLYYFTRLRLICPDLGELCSIAGYAAPPEFNRGRPPRIKTLDIPDKALDLAWLILDHCTKLPGSPKGRLSIWLPICLFSAALVVWYKLVSPGTTSRRYGTLRVLDTFKSEITRLPWPCCREMTKTLDRLMER